MRYSYAAISMIIVGMMAFVILMVFQDVTINNEADYYSIKEEWRLLWLSLLIKVTMLGQVN